MHLFSESILSIKDGHDEEEEEEEEMEKEEIVRATHSLSVKEKIKNFH